jgi:hypothetical protein
VGCKGLEDEERLEFQEAGACPDHVASPGAFFPVPARFLLPALRLRLLSWRSQKCRALPAPCRLLFVVQVNDCLMRDSSFLTCVKHSKDVQKGRRCRTRSISITPEKKIPQNPEGTAV